MATSEATTLPSASRMRSRPLVMGAPTATVPEIWFEGVVAVASGPWLQAARAAAMATDMPSARTEEQGANAVDEPGICMQTSRSGSRAPGVPKDLSDWARSPPGYRWQCLQH